MLLDCMLGVYKNRVVERTTWENREYCRIVFHRAHQVPGAFVRQRPLEKRGVQMEIGTRRRSGKFLGGSVVVVVGMVGMFGGMSC